MAKQTYIKKKLCEITGKYPLKIENLNLCYSAVETLFKNIKQILELNKYTFKLYDIANICGDLIISNNYVAICDSMFSNEMNVIKIGVMNESNFTHNIYNYKQKDKEKITFLNDNIKIYKIKDTNNYMIVTNIGEELDDNIICFIIYFLKHANNIESNKIILHTRDDYVRNQIKKKKESLETYVSPSVYLHTYKYFIDKNNVDELLYLTDMVCINNDRPDDFNYKYLYVDNGCKNSISMNIDEIERNITINERIYLNEERKNNEEICKKKEEASSPESMRIEALKKFTESQKKSSAPSLTSSAPPFIAKELYHHSDKGILIYYYYNQYHVPIYYYYDKKHNKQYYNINDKNEHYIDENGIFIYYYDEYGITYYYYYKTNTEIRYLETVYKKYLKYKTKYLNLKKQLETKNSQQN